MGADEDLDEVRIGEVANELEAAMVVNMLNEDGIPARSDATPAMTPFGGLPFESGHAIFVPASQARRAREILSHYPHFKDLKDAPEPEL
jgi:hypothetical protein